MEPSTQVCMGGYEGSESEAEEEVSCPAEAGPVSNLRRHGKGCVRDLPLSFCPFLGWRKEVDDAFCPVVMVGQSHFAQVSFNCLMKALTFQL